MRLRIATFNVENLVSRNAYGPKARPQTGPALSLFDFADPEMRDHIQAAIAVALEDDERLATALAIAETRADILCLQEVDGLGVLAPFLSNYVHALGDIRYGHMRLEPGNDPRGIDVAFCARKDLVDDEARIRSRSWREATFADLGVHDDDLAAMGIAAESRVFNRDCLEVDLDLGETSLTIFICHFKSTGYGPRSGSPVLRRAEARAVRAIVERRFGAGWREASWIVAGDLNAATSAILPGGAIVDVSDSGLEPLLDDFAVDPARSLPPGERWTYFHRETAEGRVLAERHVQLDRVLLSPALAAANPGARVEILRRGLPYRVPLDPAHPDRSIGHLATRADRYPRIGWDRPRASDHCPVVVEIDLPPAPA
ncbi:endonuclease/exonuclease/phosphatase family protein [Salinarimonas ramus]|uniref:Endonuclease n=1 Tax=Salinarimonas ramus TaxID=690164 RepID=A0A917V226_9HYPH|nr:endonuclease/exonuclease/phosphatase family protein [Salinarimonas ramus]GGK19138.1 endonuclease [Salinarimonas ramus]